MMRREHLRWIAIVWEPSKSQLICGWPPETDRHANN